MLPRLFENQDGLRDDDDQVMGRFGTFHLGKFWNNPRYGKPSVITMTTTSYVTPFTVTSTSISVKIIRCIGRPIIRYKSFQCFLSGFFLFIQTKANLKTKTRQLVVNDENGTATFTTCP